MPKGPKANLLEWLSAAVLGGSIEMQTLMA